jgi:acyl transferase domain-containing protein/aryl carrier-like protein
MSDSSRSGDLSGIAVIGLACRFPGASTAEEFWRNLRGGVETIRTLSDDDLRSAGVPEALANAPGYVRASSYVDDLEMFDAAFFDINPREAEILDPQQRLYLECAWEAFESAGYDCRTFPGRIGVYAGSRISDYFLYHLLLNPAVIETVGPLQIQFGNDKDYLATFTSYKLNLRGPSVSVQTACSSSLVGVHFACESLLSGECDLAIAGGVSVHLPAKAGYPFQPGGLLSPDGHCRSFDARAAGTVFGSGVGIVVLRRLKDAMSAGDNVRAVIRGSAINNDGSLKVGFTAPSEEGQAGVITEAMAVAGVEPDEISYVEAHGSGTPIGDPIEIAALSRAFRQKTARKGFCWIGSVKSNVGHLESASGAAGIIKTVLALENGALPPSLHFETPNPQIDFTNSPFAVNTELRAWGGDGHPRVAGVSSFGLGGTNSHVILQEAPEPAPSGLSRPWQILLLSARSDSALRAAARRLHDHLRQNPASSLPDAAFTLQTGRHAFEHRQAVLCQGVDEALRALESLDPNRVFASVEETRERPIAFLFSGLGEEYPGMARGLYQSERVFRQHLDACAEILGRCKGLDLMAALHPEEDAAVASGGERPEVDLRRLLGRGGAPAADASTARLRQTAVAQPAVFAVEYALARLWMSWGIRPQSMIGYSLGEYVAACLAGVMSLEDALVLVAERARMIQELPSGAMVAVPLSEAEILPLLSERVSISAVNGPADCIVSGWPDAVAALEERLASLGVVSRRLETTHAFHSVMMDPIVAAFVERVRQTELREPRIPYVSDVTGAWIRAEEATDPAYWGRHLRQTVRFADGLGEILAEPDRVLLEVGPGQSLGVVARRHPRRAAGQIVLTSLRHRDYRQPDEAFLLTALARLWLAGVRVDWSGFHRGERRRRVLLPGYPFERRRFWLDPPVDRAPLLARTVARKLTDLTDWFHVPVWRQSPRPEVDDGAERFRNARVLLLKDDTGCGERLADRLREAGAAVVTATPGDRFAVQDPAACIVRPGSFEDFDAVLREMERSGGLPDTVLHLWSLTSDPAPVGAPESLYQRGFQSLLALMQALGHRVLPGPTRFFLLANGLADVTGEEPLCPEKALLVGASRVVPQEYPDLVVRLADLGPPSRAERFERDLFDLLLAESWHDRGSGFLAWRKGRHWVQDFEPVRLRPRADQASAFRRGGVYVITGGLGGLGLALAEHLARTAAARLVLVGRSAAEGDRLVKLRAIEALGGEVLVAQADVADGAQMREVFTRARERFGAVHGVIHAAGLPGGSIIQLSTPERLIPVLAPKVEGTRRIGELAEDLLPELELLVLFGSTLSFLGGVGQSAYAAANAYLDAFAPAWQARTGRRAVTVSWDRWVETGMAAGPAEEGILTAEGLECLERIVSRPAIEHVVVSTRPFRAALEKAALESRAWVVDAAREAAPGGEHPRPDLQSPYVPPQTEPEALLIGLWQSLLGIERIGIHDNFFELGGDSLRGIQLVALARKVDLELTAAELFEHPTVAQLAAALLARPQAAEPGLPMAVPQVRISDEELEQLAAIYDDFGIDD